MKKLILIITLTFLMTGCWNYHELNQIAIVSGMAIDKVNNDFLVTLQIMNAKKTVENSGNSNQSKVTVYQSKGKTIIEAIRNASLTSPKKLYFSHLNIMIVSSALAQYGLSNFSEFILRIPEGKKQVMLLISKEPSAGDILKILTPLETYPTQNILDGIQNSHRVNGVTAKVSYDNFISAVLDEGIDPILSGIEIIGTVEKGENENNLKTSQANTDTKMTGMAVFKGDKLVGWLDEMDSKMYNILTNNLNTTILSTKCDPDHYMSIEAIKPKTNIKPVIKNNQLTLTINTNMSASLFSIDCSIDIKDPKNIKLLETKIQKAVAKDINNLINKTNQVYQSDVIGFGQALYKATPNIWKKYKHNWDDLLKSAQIDLKVKVRLEEKGTLINTEKNEVNKSDERKN